MCQFVGMLLFDVKIYEIEYVNIWSAETLEEAQDILEQYVDEASRKPLMFEVVATKDMKEI